MLTLILRLVLGAIFLLYGIDGFLHFMSNSVASGKAANFISAMIESGYLWPLLKIGETVGGAMLLLNLYVPLALVLLAPIVVNILCFHFFLNPGGLAVGIYPIGVTIAILELSLAWLYRDYFKGLFVRSAIAQSLRLENDSTAESSQ